MRMTDRLTRLVFVLMVVYGVAVCVYLPDALTLR